MNASFSGVSRGTRAKESKHVCSVSRDFHPARNTDQQVQHMCKFLWSGSKRVCTFLTIFTRLEPTAIGGELWFACEGTGVSTGGRAHSSPFFCGTDQGVQHVCTGFFCSNAWLCARQPTDRDLASVIPDEKEKKRERERGQK